MIDIAVRAAQAGSVVLMQAFGSSIAVQAKGDISNVVTEADLASERSILAHLLEQTPAHGVLAEETGYKPGTSGYTWVVDPLDGTSNFAAGIPWFGVLIALLRGCEPVAAVMHLPCENDTYTAVLGEGALLNGRPVRVSASKSLGDVLWAYGMDAKPGGSERLHDARLLSELLGRVRNIRATNSLVDAALTADGRLGGMLNRSTRIWDIASPMLVVSEAGGLYTSASGAPVALQVSSEGADRVYQVLAGAPALHASVAQLVREHDASAA